jgi:preprotein translocase subunit SecE
MSRLQKKKPAILKKDKKTEAELSSDSDLKGSASPAADKTAAVSIQKKPRIEKAIGDIKKSEPNFFQKAVEFFREVKVELKKVTWPTRKQTVGTTIVVIVFVFVIAAFLGLFDYALLKLVQVVLT